VHVFGQSLAMVFRSDQSAKQIVAKPLPHARKRRVGHPPPLAFTAETSDKTSTMFVELLDGLNRALAQRSKGVTVKQAIVDEDLPMA
jgi:hypothetical protein